MKHKGSCHCGAVQFEVNGEFAQGTSCNCSICQRKGYILGFVSDSNFQLVKGSEYLTDYQFGKKRINHTFCKVCGVSAFSSGLSPKGDSVKAINLRCLEEFPIENLSIHSFDGKSL